MTSGNPARLPPQRVYARHGVARDRQRHVVIQKPRDPGKAGECLPGLLRRHLSRQSGRAAIQRALIHWPTSSRRPFTQENHRLGDTIHFFYRMSLPARDSHGRKEMQVVHRFLPVDRDAARSNPMKRTFLRLVPCRKQDLFKNLLVAGYTVGKWQATLLPGRYSRSSGRSVRQRSTAIGQRGWKRQPDGGLIGLGTSPVRTMRLRVRRRRLGYRHGRDQRLGIGMGRRGENLFRRPCLDDRAEIHDRDAGRDLAHHDRSWAMKI